MDRLQELRGPVPPVEHDARAIAALTANPGCARRALLDAAGVDKRLTARHLGFPAPFGRSRFAITRDRGFTTLVKENGYAELLRLLRELLGTHVAAPACHDVATVEPHLRPSHTRALIDRAARDGDDTAAALYDHPLLGLTIAGHTSFLEPDVAVFRLGPHFHVVEIKSFAVIDGQADPAKVTAAARQGAVYVLALRELLADLGHEPERVSHEIILVCPKNFANHPVATAVDVRRQLAVLRRQLARMTRIDDIVATLPPGLTFDLARDTGGRPTRPAAELAAALAQVPARYVPECLSTCELCMFCRREARDRGATDLLGRRVRDELGGLADVEEALALAVGVREPATGQEEIARLLRLADRLRAECLGVAG